MGKINVVDQSGQLGSLTPEEFKEAKQYGFRQATDGEVKDYFDKEKYGQGFGNAAAAFGESALGAATFGLSRQMENQSGLTTPEAQAAREKFHPTASGLGTATGIVAPLLIAPEAEAFEAADLLNPVNAVSKAGSKVTSAVTSALPKATGPVGEILGKSASLGLGSAVEGGALALGQSVTEDALGDPDALGQKLVSNIGYGALFGGALGGVLGASEIAVPKALDKAKESLQKLCNFGVDSEGPLANAAASASSFISGKPKQAILDAWKDRGVFTENPEARQQMVSKAADAAQEHLDQLQGALKAANRDIRPEETYQSLQGMPVQAAQEQAGAVANKVKGVLDEMELHPALYPKSIPYKLKMLQDEFTNTASKATSSGAVFDAINDLKQNIDSKFPIFGKMISPEFADSANALKGLRTELKNHLENENIWGQAAARQAAFNDAQGQLLHLTKKGGEFYKAFMAPALKRTGSVIGEISPSKMQTFFRQIHTLQGSAKEEAFHAFVDASKNLIDEIENSYKNAPGRVFDRKAIESVAEKHLNYTQSALKQAEMARNLGMLGSGGHNAYIGEGAAMGFGFYHPAIGAAIEAFTMARNPGLVIQRLAKIEKLADQTTKIIGKSAKAIFKTGAKVSEDFTGFAGSKLAPSEVIGDKAAEKKPKYKEVIARIQELQSDPERMVDALTKATGSLGDHAPQTAQSVQQTATRATEYLATKAPQVMPTGPLGREPEISTAELTKFERIYSVVEKPLQVLAQIKSGMLTSESVEAVQVVYPKLYQEMQSAIMNELSNVVARRGKEAVPFKTKMALSTFLGQDMDLSLAQNTIMSNQLSLKAPTQQQGLGAPGPRAPQAGLAKLGQSTHALTASQKSAERADT